MLWFILALALTVIIIPSIALARFGGDPTVVPEVPEVPEELALQLAKTVIERKFKKAHFRTKPDVDLFPTKKTCPHCQNEDRKVWDSTEAAELLSDIGELAQGIRQRRFCRGCLDQLSEIAKKRKEHLLELGEKKDSQSPSPPVSRRVVVPLFLGAIFWPPLLIPATFIVAVRKRGVYWLPFIFTTSFFLCLTVLSLAVLDLPFLDLPLIKVVVERLRF